MFISDPSPPRFRFESASESATGRYPIRSESERKIWNRIWYDKNPIRSVYTPTQFILRQLSTKQGITAHTATCRSNRTDAYGIMLPLHTIATLTKLSVETKMHHI